MFIPSLLYILLCLIAAVLARETRLGFLGTLVVAFFLTPIWAFAGLLFFGPSSRPRK